MADKLLIRPADPDDFDGLLSLYHDLVPEDRAATDEQRRQTYRQILEQPGLTVLLAFLDDKAVATLTVVIVPNLTRGCAPYALIENVGTSTALRGRGLGKRLMAEAIDHCWQAGCFKIMLLSGSNNLEAHRFYDGLGFTTTKTGFELRKSGYAARKID